MTWDRITVRKNLISLMGSKLICKRCKQGFHLGEQIYSHISNGRCTRSRNYYHEKCYNELWL